MNSCSEIFQFSTVKADDFPDNYELFENGLN